MDQNILKTNLDDKFLDFYVSLSAASAPPRRTFEKSHQRNTIDFDRSNVSKYSQKH
jgi:hypothetical protein